MKRSYGEVIVKKGSILYHTSDEPFEIKDQNDKPMLFCTFHPSEWDVMNEYATFIKLKKDISLLFMIESFKKAKYFILYKNIILLFSQKYSKFQKNIHFLLIFYISKISIIYYLYIYIYVYYLYNNLNEYFYEILKIFVKIIIFYL